MEWRLYPMDVLFFRGTEPMNAGEAGVVHGLFPPSPEVLQGMVRTTALEVLGIAPASYAAEGAKLAGRLNLRGPYLLVDRGQDGVERWFPAPLDLWQQKGDNFWRPGRPSTEDEAVTSDLGRVPFITTEGKGAGRWIRQDGLEAYLRGQPVPAEQVENARMFYLHEPRVGIARDRTTRTTVEGMLYAPAFVRLCETARGGRVGLGLRVAGFDDLFPDGHRGVIRLGGEGRMAALEVHSGPAAPASGAAGDTVRLLLLTPGRWRGSWLPSGITGSLGNWQGSLGDASVRLVSAVVGKPVRIGGWDMTARGGRGEPKPAQACVPPGSVYYLQVTDGTAKVDLHDRSIGNHGDVAVGFGHVLTGRWNRGEPR